MRRAAELGLYAPAQARLAAETRGVERFAWAESAAAQGDRDGLTALGQCHAVGGCEKNEARAMDLFRMGAALEDPTAMYELVVGIQRTALTDIECGCKRKAGVSSRSCCFSRSSKTADEVLPDGSSHGVVGV